MAHPNAPLSYDALKHVLQHMDPNKRALLVSRCPKLKAPNRVVPQRIESMCLWPAQIRINNTFYRLGVIQQYPEGAAIPQEQAVLNYGGGEDFDVDNFGFRIPTPEVTPGDFPLSVIEEDQNVYQEGLIYVEWRLEQLLEQRKNLELFGEMKIDEDEEDELDREELLEYLNGEIAEVESEIVRHQSKIDNDDRNIPFTIHLQLTIFTMGPDDPDDRRVIQSIERFQYNQNLGPAMKYLIGRLLDKPMNYVNELRVVALHDQDCFWLPAQLNLTARHLRINGEHSGLVMRTVGQFLHRNNQRPFKTFAFEPCHQVNYDVDIANAAETLIIKGINPEFPIHTMRNRRVHFKACPNYVYLIPLIDYWVRNGAPIGTYFTAYTTTWQGFIWYNSVRQREGHTIAETPTRRVQCLPNCVILPLAYNVQLEFYLTLIRNQYYPFQFHLEVQPRN